MKVILIKYGELTTKGDNRKYFINVLYNNIKKALEGSDVEAIKSATEKLTTVFYSITEQLYKANAQNGAAAGATEGTEANVENGGNNGTVYDADYKVEDDGNNDNK